MPIPSEPYNHAWLREYIDIQLRAHSREDELQFKSLAQELVLQAKEYERRLSELNHAHEQAREALATYVPRDKYDAVILRLDKDVHDLQLYRANSEGRAAVIAIASSGAMSLLIGIILRFILK